MNFSNKFSHVRLFLRHHDDRVWLRKGRRHIIHLVKNLLADDRQADRRMRVMSRRVSWFQLMLTFHVSRWMTASPMWQQNNQLTSANQVIVFFANQVRIVSAHHITIIILFFLPSTTLEFSYHCLWSHFLFIIFLYISLMTLFVSTYNFLYFSKLDFIFEFKMRLVSTQSETLRNWVLC